jgi:hypothetical protein
MTGKAYYITTVADWQRHAPRCASSHYIVLDPDGRHSERSAPVPETVVFADPANPPAHAVEESLFASGTKILLLVEADEGAHLALESDPAFEALPHPLAQRPISAAAQSALAPHGVPAGATTFDAAEALARVHPLLKHRIF